MPAAAVIPAHQVFFIIVVVKKFLALTIYYFEVAISGGSKCVAQEAFLSSHSSGDARL